MLELPYAFHKPIISAAYLQWIRGYVRNTGLDELARDVVLGKGVVTNAGPASFYSGGSTPDEWADRLCAAFLGMRLQCAQCHQATRANWTPNDWLAFTAFFSQLTPRQVPAERGQVELVLLDLKREKLHRETLKPIVPRFPDGTTPKIREGQDRREVLAVWLTSPKNPYFARNLANRIWLHLLGKGLADPPEALAETTVTANNELLDFLTNELVAQRFDAKAIIRLIMNSRVYQLSQEKIAFNSDDEKYFTRGYPKPIDSEVLIEVLNQFLELSHEGTGMPRRARAIRTVASDVPLFAISRPVRITACEAERDRNLASHIHIINSDWMQPRLQAPANRLGRLLAEERSDREILDELFLAAFSRLPTDDVRKQAAAHFARAKSRRAGFEDVLWAIINTKEFVWRP